VKRLKRAAVGAADLSLELLVDALDRVLAAGNYRLEWVPGVLGDGSGDAKLYLRWLSGPDCGAWLVLPREPHGRRIASALLGELGRPLVCHQANWFGQGRRGELGVASDERSPDGTSRPRPTGLEGVDLESIAEGGPESQLQGLLCRMIGIRHERDAARHDFSLYEVGGPAEGPPGPGAGGEVSEGRIAEVLGLLRRPGARATLIREGPDSFLATIRGAEDYRMNYYLNEATAGALSAAVEGEGLPALSRPSIRG
jgi:hypothetical protein